MSIIHFKIISKTPEQTREIGADLGKLAEKGDLILLVGNLGAGKTCFSQGLAQGIGFSGYASSPSFVLVREYQGRLKVYHIDFYRLDDIEEIEGIGMEEYLSGDGVCVIEWADKAPGLFRQNHLLIEFEHLQAPEERQLRFEARGQRYTNLLRKLEGKWNLP
ncbi:MAG: tRNA (adenosine(37)-N6)-threonylcarbamoyltransferase complex ATPase subunit type 1 TsaE [Dehalococcoidia bacterium]|nr:tRNA (adenosine(37)-N6)-threonylcarbamoyltransferase complex ATPase subunit type 1 TsaE [Dehalococcoidia bacterium]